MDPIRRKILAAGGRGDGEAAARARLANRRARRAAMSSMKKDRFASTMRRPVPASPLLLIAAGIDSTISGLTRGDPFNPIQESRRVPLHRVGPAQCNDGQSSGPLEIDRPWDAYTDDQLV